MNNAKIYIPVVFLSINYNFKTLDLLGQKQISNNSKTNKNYNLDYLIDPAFRDINRLFEISFKNGDDDTKRNVFDEYFLLLVEIKYFNALIHNKPFFYQPVKSKQKA